MKKRIIFIGMLASSLLALTGCGKTTIDANEYLELEVNGYDTAGKVSCKFDAEQLVMDNLEAFGLSDASEMEYYSVIMNIEEYLSGEPDKKEELSNGDTVTFKWNESKADKLEEKYKVNIKTDDKVIDVSALEEPEEIDLFEYVNVTFDGIAPNGRVNISTESNIPVKISFTADKTDTLKNGDVIKITAQAPSGTDIADYCFQNGYVPKETEKEYTVEGLAAYAMSIDEIPADVQDKMKKQAEDTIRAGTTSWNEVNSLKGLEFAGYYFLSVKDGFSASPVNKIYCVYKMTANITGIPEANKDDENRVEECGEEVYYTGYSYSDIILLSDGTCSVDYSLGKEINNRIPTEHGYWSWGYFEHYSLNGYKDLDTMFNNCITSQIEKYDYVSTVE